MKKGIYVVVDPKMEEELLLRKLKAILTKEISAIQIWDHFGSELEMASLIEKIHSLCEQSNTPLLINNHWKYAQDLGLNGVHFDEIPNEFEEIKSSLGRDVIYGLTCGNDLAKVQWAAENQIDYISFCSMFPSSSAGVCEIVSNETVRQAVEMFKNPIFLAGGIKLENLEELPKVDFYGVAVISDVMNADDPAKKIEEYYKILKY